MWCPGDNEVPELNSRLPQAKYVLQPSELPTSPSPRNLVLCVVTLTHRHSSHLTIMIYYPVSALTIIS